MQPTLTLAKLRLSMVGVLALVIGLGTLILTAIFMYLMPATSFEYLMIYALLFAVAIHIIQWLIGPKIIEAIYRVKEFPKDSPLYHRLKDIVRRVSEVSGLSEVPKLMYADIKIPNAFAYGTPFSGYKVALTRGLLENLPIDEVEAVVAHEIGHIKHKDIVVMMIISIIPAIIYWLGQMLYRVAIFSAFLGGRREREAGAAPALFLLLGLLLIALSFVFNLITLYLSRLREYYADSHAALTVRDGARKLQRALARILLISGALKSMGYNVGKYSQFKSFFIEDPEQGIVVRGYRYDIDKIVEEIKRMKPSALEIFSSHPHPAKRLRFLDQFVTA